MESKILLRVGMTDELLHKLETRKSESRYWGGCYRFVLSIEYGGVSKLTMRQHNWLINIIEDLKEKRT